jgi:hypothetical protein
MTHPSIPSFAPAGRRAAVSRRRSRVRRAGCVLSLAAAILAAPAAAGEPPLNLNGTWKDEHGMEICLVHTGNRVDGYDEPNSVCPNGQPRGHVYLENGTIRETGEFAPMLSGNLYPCANPTLVSDCGHAPSWGPSVFTSDRLSAKRIRGTRQGEYWEDCVLVRDRQKEKKRRFSLVRVRKCDLEGVCDAIDAMVTSIDRNRSIDTTEVQGEMRSQLNLLRKRTECLACQGRRSRTQELVDGLLSDVNRLRNPRLAPRLSGRECWHGLSEQECADAHVLAEIDAALAELGGSLGCGPVVPVEGATPGQCIYNCLNTLTGRYIVDKLNPASDPVANAMTAAACVECRETGEREPCMTCLDGVARKIPLSGESIDVGRCVQECSECPENCPMEHVCQEDRVVCHPPSFPSERPSWCTTRCNVKRHQWVFPPECIPGSFRSECP